MCAASGGGGGASARDVRATGATDAAAVGLAEPGRAGATGPAVATLPAADAQGDATAAAARLKIKSIVETEVEPFHDFFVKIS